MRLKCITIADKEVPLSIRIHESTQQQLEAYIAYYEETYGKGHRLSMSMAIDAICKEFMAKDKGFKEFMKDYTPTSKPTKRRGRPPKNTKSEESAENHDQEEKNNTHEPEIEQETREDDDLSMTLGSATVIS